MDVISRLPGCARQAADSICLYTGKNGRCSQIVENSQSQNVQIFGYIYQSRNGQNHGPIWKTQSFLSKGICTVIVWQDYYGKGNLRKFYWNTVGKILKLGVLMCQPSKRIILIRVCGRHQTGRQTENIKTDLENSPKRR